MQSFLAQERPRSLLIGAGVLESWRGRNDAKTMENFSSSARLRRSKVPRLLRNPIEPRYLDPGQVLQYWLAQFSIISGPSCGKFRWEPGLF